MSAATLDLAYVIPGPSRPSNPIPPALLAASAARRTRTSRPADPWDAILGPPPPVVFVGAFLRLTRFYAPGYGLKLDDLFGDFLDWLPPSLRLGWTKAQFTAGLPPECPVGRPLSQSHHFVGNLRAEPLDADARPLAPLILMPDRNDSGKKALVHADGYRPPRGFFVSQPANAGPGRRPKAS